MFEEVALEENDFAGQGMSLENFLEPFDLSVLRNEDAKIKYGAYKCSSAKDQLNDYFEKHKNEQWFKEKYHPDHIQILENGYKNRLEVFLEIFTEEFSNTCLFDLDKKSLLLSLIDKFNLKIMKDKKAKCYLYFPALSHNISKKDFEKILAENDSFISLNICDPIVAKSSKTGEEKSCAMRRPAFASFSSTQIDISLFIKMAESFDMMRVEMEESANQAMEANRVPDSDDEAVQQNPAPVQSTKDKDLYQKSFSNVREIILEEMVPIKMCKLDAFRTQTVESLRRSIVIAAQTIFWLDTIRDLYNQEEAMENLKKILPVMEVINVNGNKESAFYTFVPWHLKYIDPREDVPSTVFMLSKIIDQRPGSNPILGNLIDFLVVEDSSDIATQQTSTDSELREQLKTALDRLLIYLRLVHSIDFYGPSSMINESSMPYPCGLTHVRPKAFIGDVKPTDQFKSFMIFGRQILNILRLNTPVIYPKVAMPEFTEESNDENDPRIKRLNAIIKSDTVITKLGLRDPEDAVEQFVKENTKRKKRKVDIIWLCPLSGKKFREPIFVRKHIMNKFADKVIQVKKDNSVFFNNYLLDPSRPQLILKDKCNKKLKTKAPTINAPVPGRPRQINNQWRGNFDNKKNRSYRDLDAPV